MFKSCSHNHIRAKVRGRPYPIVDITRNTQIYTYILYIIINIKYYSPFLSSGCAADTYSYFSFFFLYIIKLSTTRWHRTWLKNLWKYVLFMKCSIRMFAFAYNMCTLYIILYSVYLYILYTLMYIKYLVHVWVNILWWRKRI